MKLDYNQRNVDFSKIHATHPIHFQIFFEIFKSVPHSKVLDIGGGYGSVLLEFFHRFGWPDFQYDILESSELQIKKGLSFLQQLPGYDDFKKYHHYYHSDFLNYPTTPKYYNQILLKMVFHEFSKDLQPKVLKKIVNFLKPGGYLTVWMPYLNNDTQKFFSQVISHKDQYAGFSEMASNRYFAKESEFLDWVKSAGFKVSPPKFIFEYILDTHLRLEPEFNNNVKSYSLWLDQIRKSYGCLDHIIQNQISFLDYNTGIFLRFKRALYQLWLPD